MRKNPRRILGSPAPPETLSPQYKALRFNDLAFCCVVLGPWTRDRWLFCYFLHFCFVVGGVRVMRQRVARMMRRAGVPLQEIMRIGGWKTMAMVVRYCGDSLHGTRKALEQADSIF